MTPALARLKRAVRTAVSRCGGVDGAGATAHRSRSVAGDWANLNAPAFPPADCALALDEACVAMGQRPEILSAMAGELGFVLLPLPDAGGGAETEIGMLVMAVADELGDVCARVREAMADREVKPAEAARIESEVEDLIQRAVQLKAHLRALQGANVIVIREGER